MRGEHDAGGRARASRCDAIGGAVDAIRMDAGRRVGRTRDVFHGKERHENRARARVVVDVG